MYKNIIGIIGAGRISKVHAYALHTYHSNVRIKYLTDPFLNDDMKAWAEEYGVELAINNADDVFNDPEVDSVFICSPTHTHCDFIRKACKTGKNVYCEKPLSDNIEEVRKTMDAINLSGIKFFMGFMRRFDDNHQKIRKMITDGKIGKPQIIKLLSRDPEPPPKDYVKTSGGYFFDSMIHDFDLARFYSGSEVMEVYAIGNALINPEIAAYDIDTAICTLKFEDGAVGVIDLSRKSNCGYDQRTEIHASKACVQMDNVSEDKIFIRNEDGVKSSKPLYFFLERYEKAFIKAQKAFLSVVNEGLDTPVTAFDGLQALRLAKAAQMSYEKNLPIKIADI